MPAGPEIAILDELGEALPAGSTGEVAIRGVNVFGGYVANPEANASAFSNGWFRTGDEGRLDTDGCLRLSGRLKEIINRGGEKIAPAEIDDVLLRHPAVAQAVTFAIPDPRLGEEVGAAVVLSEPGAVDARQLQDFASLTIAPFKVPRTIVFVEEIPKGPTGKLQRIGLHERLGVDAPAGEPRDAVGSTRPRTYLERWLAEVWCDVLGIPAIGDHDDFFALGGDSILGAEMVARVRDLTGRADLPLVSIVRAPTLLAFAAEVGDIVVRGEGALVPITKGGDRTPFFLVHGADGDVLGFPALARRLRAGRPFYGLQARLGEDGELLDASVEEMAAAYLAEIEAAQPGAPYLLGGFCAGAPIAIEMARLLLDRGRPVEPLVLIDPRLRPRRDLVYFARRLRTRARSGQLRRVVGQRARRVLPRAPAPGRSPAPEAPILARLRAIRDAYVLRPLDVPAVLVTSGDYDELGVPRETWTESLGSIRPLSFDGSHQHLFLPPAVDGLAAAVQAALDEVDH
jgi:thioesterase domain-containing protein